MKIEFSDRPTGRTPPRRCRSELDMTTPAERTISEDTYSSASGTWRIVSRTIRPLMPPQLEAY